MRLGRQAGRDEAKYIEQILVRICPCIVRSRAMSLLQEIIDAASGSEVPLTDILRKCLVLATRLRNEHLRQWVLQELNGYSADTQLPKYRVSAELESCGNFVSSTHGWNSQPIPTAFLSEEDRQSVEQAEWRDGIAAYEQLAKENDAGDLLRIQWPANLIALYQRKFGTNFFLSDAWIDVPRSRLVLLVDTVRTKVLDFSLQLEGEAPEAGEPGTITSSISPDRVTQHFTNIIMGDNAVVASHAGDVSATHQHVMVQYGDIESLMKALAGLGADRVDLDELQDALQSEPEPANDQGFGPKLNGWVTKMTNKAAEGALKVGENSANSIITQALLRYFGLG